MILTRTPARRLQDFARGLLLIHVFIAACAVLLCLAAERTFLGHVPPLLSPLHGLLAASTLVTYNSHALVNGNWATGSALSRADKRLHMVVAVAAAATTLCLLPFVSHKIWTGLAVLGVVTGFYSLPLLPSLNKRRLKDFGALKLGVLAGIWVLSTTWLPALKWQVPSGVFWPEIFIRACWLLALCIAFDIRDVAADRAAGIRTLPVRFGAPVAYAVAYATLGLSVAFARALPAVSSASCMATIIGGAYACWAIEWSRRRPSDTAYVLLVDGALAVYAGAVLAL